MQFIPLDDESRGSLACAAHLERVSLYRPQSFAKVCTRPVRVWKQHRLDQTHKASSSLIAADRLAIR